MKMSGSDNTSTNQEGQLAKMAEQLRIMLAKERRITRLQSAWRGIKALLRHTRAHRNGKAGESYPAGSVRLQSKRGDQASQSFAGDSKMGMPLCSFRWLQRKVSRGYAQVSTSRNEGSKLNAWMFEFLKLLEMQKRRQLFGLYRSIEGIKAARGTHCPA